jgi:hypothetical protein
MNHSDLPVGQAELPLRRKPQQATVPREMIWAKRFPGQAIRLAVDTAMLDDKEVYMPLEIDSATWSRILHSKNSLPPEKVSLFCEVVENRIYPEWQAYQVGCTLMLVESEAERLYRLEKERADRAELALDLVVSSLRKV